MDEVALVDLAVILAAALQGLVRLVRPIAVVEDPDATGLARQIGRLGHRPRPLVCAKRPCVTCIGLLSSI